MRILLPGNRALQRGGEETCGEGGFILLDALLCLFTAILLLLLLERWGVSALRVSRRALERSWAVVRERSGLPGEGFNGE
ncbi:MAG: hypothetical protein LBQ35_06975 [Spirochaetaceae bacterium]|jgi:hypothetical protein|nr:hypothetical protein [Spirochaetaceae bacterium]